MPNLIPPMECSGEDICSLEKSVIQDIITFTKTQYTNDPDIAELGDYTPFLWYFGEQDWVKHHILTHISRIMDDSPPSAREDTVLGLIEFLRQTDDQRIKSEIKNYFSRFRELHVQNGIITTQYFDWLAYGTSIAKKRHSSRFMKSAALFCHPILSFISKYYSGRQLVFPRNNVFIEFLVDFYQIAGDETYLEFAAEIADEILKLPSFETHGLFASPRRLSGISDQARLFKDNTAAMNGIIALAHETKNNKYREAYKKWSKSVHEKFFKDELYGLYNFRTKTVANPKLLYAPPMIDSLCYAHKVFRDAEFIEFAKEVAEIWIQRQAPTGLIPYFPNGNYSHMDSMTDFSVSLYRLFEISGNSIYLDSAEKAVKALYSSHRFNLYANVSDGSPTTDDIIPRFVPLMAKVPIARNNSPIMEGDIFKLLRDR